MQGVERGGGELFGMNLRGECEQPRGAVVARFHLRYASFSVLHGC